MWVGYGAGGEDTGGEEPMMIPRFEIETRGRVKEKIAG